MVLHDKAIEDLCTSQRNGLYTYSNTTPLYEPSSIGLGYMSKVNWELQGSEKPMIDPFVSNLVKENENGQKVISYGLSSMGYDVRLADTVKIFTNANAKVIDPIHHDEDNFLEAKINTDDNGLRYFILPPNSYALGHTLETFSIPREVIVLVLGKSTYARASIIVNTTPIEPEFEGQVVIELANGCSSPVKIYLDGGIAQFVFLKGVEPCEVSYLDRGGKYHGQSGIEHAKA